MNDDYNMIYELQKLLQYLQGAYHTCENDSASRTFLTAYNSLLKIIYDIKNNNNSINIPKKPDKSLHEYLNERINAATRGEILITDMAWRDMEGHEK